MIKRLCYLITFIFCFSSLAEDTFIKKHLMKEKINWFDRPTSESLYSVSQFGLLESSYKGSLVILPLSEVKLYDNEKLNGEPVYISDKNGIARNGVPICSSLKEGTQALYPVKYKIGLNGNVYKFVASKNSTHFKEQFVVERISGEPSVCAAYPFLEYANGNSGSVFSLKFSDKINDKYITHDLDGNKLYFKINKNLIRRENNRAKKIKRDRKCFLKITENDSFKKKVIELTKNLSATTVTDDLYPKELMLENDILVFKKKMLEKYLEFYYYEAENKEYEKPEVLCKLMNVESSKEKINEFYFRNYKKPLHNQTTTSVKYSCNELDKGRVYIRVVNPLKNYDISYIYSMIEKKLTLSSWPVMVPNHKYDFIVGAKDISWFKDENNVCKEYMN